MTRRQEQLNRRILETLATVIRSELRDPRLQMLEVTRVDINRDASHAIVYYVSSDDEYTIDEVDAALVRARGYLRSILAETLDIRYTPDLSFRYDRSVQGEARLRELFDQIEQERRERGDDGPET